MRDRAGWIAVLSTAGVLMSACGGGDDLSPDGEHFAGLDAATVAEVLENPVAMQRIEGDSAEDRRMRLQGMVINFIVCRDLFRVYEAWMTTGVAPAPNPFPVPDEPLADWPGEFASDRSALESATPIGSGRCCPGRVPAESGSRSRPASPTDRRSRMRSGRCHEARDHRLRRFADRVRRRGLHICVVIIRLGAGQGC